MNWIRCREVHLQHPSEAWGWPPRKLGLQPKVPLNFSKINLFIFHRNFGDSILKKKAQIFDFLLLDIANSFPEVSLKKDDSAKICVNLFESRFHVLFSNKCFSLFLWKWTKIFIPLRTNCLPEGSFLDFHSDFDKIVVIHSSVCRTILILESPDPSASEGGSNFIFRHFGACMAAFEVAGWLRISNLSRSRDSRFWAIQRLQKPPCRPQSVGKWSLTHRWMRQDQGFPAHVELISCDKHSSV